MVSVGTGNFAFIHAVEAITATVQKDIKRYGYEKALEAFQIRSRKWLEKMRAELENGHDPDLTDLAFNAALNYVALLLATGEI